MVTVAFSCTSGCGHGHLALESQNTQEKTSVMHQARHKLVLIIFDRVPRNLGSSLLCHVRTIPGQMSPQGFKVVTLCLQTTITRPTKFKARWCFARVIDRTACSCSSIIKWREGFSRSARGPFPSDRWGLKGRCYFVGSVSTRRGIKRNKRIYACTRMYTAQFKPPTQRT